MTYGFFVHHDADNVGVAVVDIEKGQAYKGWLMETDGSVEVVAAGNIPLGHKIALAPVATGEKVIKYGYPIGKAVQPIAKGEHVHSHNLKSLRW
ncbi:MAG: UxaA family hydrolase [Chloroflexi bacterium]|nr:UxaA family hydrolase [Chloroflexota bacterium]MCL5108091.1 UxaA family hydrolase [Chloroflexota bacterium]